MRNVEEPTAEPSTGPLEGTRFTHPAFAQIAASRVNGAISLYGSDFVHRQHIRIRIAKSDVTRSLSNDWMHPTTDPYIEVDLSEAQWATFVSSLNSSSGVPCTLAYLNGAAIPSLPDPTPRAAIFAKEVAATTAKSIKHLAELTLLINSMGLSGTKTASLLKKVDAARSSISNNVKFVGEQFGEHMHKVTEAAKTEVNAYVTNAVSRAGLQALEGGSKLIELTDNANKRTNGHG